MIATSPVGVVTVSKGSLTPAHLAAAGVPLDTPVTGTEDVYSLAAIL